MDIDLARLTGLLAVSCLFGSMAFFSFVVAPLVFLRLEAATAGRFIRALFPWYYAVVIALSLVATLAFAIDWPLAAGIMGLVLLGGLVSRQLLMPRINSRRDRMLAGDERAAVVFRRLHRTSVAINALQLAAVLAVLVRLGTHVG